MDTTSTVNASTIYVNAFNVTRPLSSTNKANVSQNWPKIVSDLPMEFVSNARKVIISTSNLSAPNYQLIAQWSMRMEIVQNVPQLLF